MTKVAIRTLDSVTNNDTTATQLINENFTALQTAIENTLSRDGTTPNFMDANLDLNSYKIINAGMPTDNTDVITKEYFDEYVGDASGYAEAAEQSANRAATSAQVAQGYSTAAAGAADVAQRARDFIESDPGFVAVSTDLLLGENSSIKKTSDDLANIDTVAGSIANVNAVGTDITNVNAVAGDLTNIDSVVTNMTDINNVADDLTKIVAVADDLTNIDNVADDLTNIDNVADDLTNIDAVAGNNTNITAVANNATNINAVNANKTNIDTVATNIADVNAVGSDITKVTAVADDLTNIDAVNANKTNIDAVAGNNSNITAVANNAANINAVNTNKTNIDAVVANATNINTVAADITNINAVAADLTNIDAASGYAAEAKQWAIGDPSEPTAGSAKYWAQQSAASQIQADWLESDTSAKGYIRNKPTAGDNISLANNEISAVSDASPTQNSTNLVQSGGVFTSVNNLQSQIDAIVASSDVFDIVGTYAELQAYDITTVPENDIIKVLVDSTHNDAATYYRCVSVGGVKNWSYIGSEGAYYTKGEADVLLAGRANTDLSNLSVTGQAVLDAKANDSDVVKLTGDQTIAGAKTFSSSPIAPTPETSDNSTKIATTAFVNTVLETMYPVGSCYIGTTPTCPLAAFFGTWTLKSAGRVLQGADSGHSAGTTIEAGLPNIYTEIATRKYANEVGVIASVSGAGTFNNSGYPAASNVYNAGNGTSNYRLQKTTIDASVGNSIYGNSSTVQPPAYVVNIWERTA